VRGFLALAAAALVLAGCGSSSSAGSVRYTLTPSSTRGAGIYVQFSGPRGAARLVFDRFESWRGEDYVYAWSPASVIVGKDCVISAGGGKVDITVRGSNSLAQTLCSAIATGVDRGWF